MSSNKNKTQRVTLHTLILLLWCLRIQFLILNTLLTLCNKIICHLPNSRSLGCLEIPWGWNPEILKLPDLSDREGYHLSPSSWVLGYQFTHVDQTKPDLATWIGDELLVCGNWSAKVERPEGKRVRLQVAVNKLSALPRSWRVKSRKCHIYPNALFIFRGSLVWDLESHQACKECFTSKKTLQSMTAGSK